MTRDPRYDVLFEPVQIGPVTAKNRFYQVPHCTGMGTQYPHSTAKHREVKAEGGWGVVCTEMCCIHPSSDVSPFSHEKLWSDDDIPGLELMVEAVHRHGALAGCELAHEGSSAGNRMTRERAIGPSTRPSRAMPTLTRALDREDIADVRRWQKEAAVRAKRAGFDIIYVYASHTLGLPVDFISRRVNRRSDDYGGVLENRVRLLREMIEDTKDAVGDRCAVAVRFGVDEVLGEAGYTCADEGRRVVEMLAELPDLWDVNVNNLDFDMMTSRFMEEGFQEPFISFVKQVTDKPVVGVGLYTSPDRMVSLVKNGVLDFIGAARPSIADPFLPNKVRDDRIDDIRECIGCNMCLSMQYSGGPIRCTQNPTVGEEWRRGWHPERIPAKTCDARVLVVVGGPAGLEAALSLGQRSYDVTLAEAEREFGGRVEGESRLPGLQAWGRVRDYRVYQLAKMANVETYLESPMTADDVLQADFENIVIATGSRWNRDGISRALREPFAGHDRPSVYTPDDIMGGTELSGPVVVYDDEGYYMGGVIAEKLRADGLEVSLMTPDSEASRLLQFTGEKDTVQRHLLERGVAIVANRKIVSFDGGKVVSACVFTGTRLEHEARSVVVVCLREPRVELLRELRSHDDTWHDNGIQTVTAVGDCFAPGTIAEAVYAGHRYAREFGETPVASPGFRLERIALESEV